MNRNVFDRMVSGPFCNNLVGILCLQSAFMSTNKQTWGRTLTEKKCSSSQSTLGQRDHPQPCSRLCRPASTARSSKRRSSHSSSRATEERQCQVKHFCKGCEASWKVLDIFTRSPVLTVPPVPFTSAGSQLLNVT